MGSPDPILTSLKSFGLNVVRLPRERLGPLHLLRRDGDRMTVIGHVANLMQSTVATPTIRAAQAANIAGSRTRKLDLSLGLNLMGGWLAALGGQSAGLKLKYESAESVSFAFDDVKVDEVEPIEVDRYLAASIVAPTAVQARDDLEHSRLYLITRAAKSSTFTVEAETSSGHALELDVPAIQQVVGANVHVSSSNSSKSSVKYKGSKMLYFGFEAIQLFYNGSRYQGYAPLEAGAAGLLGPNDGTTQPQRVKFEFDAPFVGVDDPADLP